MLRKEEENGATVFGYWCEVIGALWRGRVRPGGGCLSIERETGVSQKSNYTVAFSWHFYPSKVVDVAVASNRPHVESMRSLRSTSDSWRDDGALKSRHFRPRLPACGYRCRDSLSRASAYRGYWKRQEVHWPAWRWPYHQGIWITEERQYTKTGTTRSRTNMGNIPTKGN